MNFLAHHLLATQILPSLEAPAAYAVGTALPDLLPLADPRKRLRHISLTSAPQSNPEEKGITEGVRMHLLTDAAFHKATTFQEAQSHVGQVIDKAGFVGIRVRRFFLAHVLTELTLDAILLRRQPDLAGHFYHDLVGADLGAVVRWTEVTVAQSLPALRGVLGHFTTARYLYSYATDEGIAEGLRRLNLQAHQDAFQGHNSYRLVETVTAAVAVVADWADPMLAETAAAVKTVVHR